VIAPSFGDIFAANSAQIGLVLVALPEEEVRGLMREDELSVDLEALTVTRPGDLATPFAFDPFRRHTLLNGLDDIGLTLRHEDEISAYEASRPPRVDTSALPG